MSLKQDFVHLHVHSTYSIQDALPQPKDLADACSDLGFPAIALTDHGKMTGVIDFVSSCRSTENYVKPIVGLEAYMCDDMLFKGGKRPKNYHLTLLAQNELGYRNLLELTAIASEQGFYYKPRIDRNVLEKYSDGIIVLSGCLASEVNQALSQDNYSEAIKTADWYKTVFGNRYFMELQYHGIEEQKRNLPQLIKIAKELNIPLVATNDVHYITKNQWKPHDVLVQIKNLKDEKTTKESNQRKAYETKQFYLKTEDQMRSIFKNYPEAVTNTMLINDMVEDYFKLDVHHMLPASKVPDDKNFTAYKANTLPYHKSNDAYLAYLAFNGLEKRGFADNKQYVSRLKKELSQIWYMGVTDYFLIYNEIVTYMKENDIMYGVRGSGVGSLVNYCLEICSVDPVRWGLLFERFLNPGRGTQYNLKFGSLDFTPDSKYVHHTSIKALRQIVKDIVKQNPNYKKYSANLSKELWVVENQDLANYYLALYESGQKVSGNELNSWLAYCLGICDTLPSGDLLVKRIAALPDVDTDIDDSRREEVIQWIKDRFGHDKVSHICAWGTYAARNSVQNCLKASDKFRSKYPEKPHEHAIKITSTIPKKPPGITIDEAIERSPDFAYWCGKFPDEIEVAKELQGKVSHLSVHAAGILISDQPIRTHAPIELSKGTFCSGYEWEHAERVGLVKYDILGLDTYHILNMARQLVKSRHGIEVDFLNMDFEDKELFKLFKSGQTSTVFQFGSPGMRDALKAVKASELEDLIAVVSLYRPGPMDYIGDYADRKLGKADYGFSHPLIEKHLGYTYGILIYQEQAMSLARDMAGFTWSEVDKLRKAISKKSGKDFDTALAMFKEKCLEKEIKISVIDEVTQLMKKFGGYAFNRSHAASYAVLAYWTAYMRYYYPSEWIASCIQVKLDDDDALSKYIKEADDCNIGIVYPDVNYSEMSTSLTKNGDIVLPLTFCKGAGTLAQSVVDNKPYADFSDLMIRAKPHKTIVKSLAAGNAFKTLDDVADMDYEDIIELFEKTKKTITSKSKSSTRSNILVSSYSLDKNKSTEKRPMTKAKLLFEGLND